jgi:hypothetical protein
MRTYLFLTIFWLVMAGLAFGYPLYNPGTRKYTILDTDWSIGWLLLAFAAWNLFRCWTSRARPPADQQATSQDRHRTS